MKLVSINNYRGAAARPRLLPVQLWCTLLFLLFMGAEAVAAGYQPDLMVRLASEGDASYLGGGLFESSALTQTKSGPAFPGKAALFLVLLKNAGDAPDSFLLRGSWNDNGLTVRYLDEGGADRAPLLSGSGYATGTLAPGASASFLVQVTPTALPLGASYRVTVSAASASDAARSDQVKTETIACSVTPAVTISVPQDNWGFPGSVVNYPYTVTNVGSSSNSFTLSVTSNSSWPGSIYADDGAGGGIAADGVRQSGESRESASTGPLAPGAAYRFFVAVGIPESSVNRTRTETRLAVTGAGASGADQVTTSAIAAVITVAESVRNLTRGGPFTASADALPGDTLQYRMTITNSGSAPATSVGIDSALPGSTVSLPGSLWVGTSSGGDGPPCAAAECGWVRESAGIIVARLGQGATDAAGGSLLPGKTLYVYFRVQVE
ncbi:MAG: hypothetical protein A2075_05725 [Geobacteraceae bacterium GWC2_58_44]|nr:MAG: hypothetical protein A2075_05725 [Geobacteraceae bacterium GWC2_58_44]